MSDEEVFADLNKLDLNDDDAVVLYGAQSKTWSTSRDQKREQRKGQQLTDRLTMTDGTLGPMCQQSRRAPSRR